MVVLGGVGQQLGVVEVGEFEVGGDELVVSGGGGLLR